LASISRRTVLVSVGVSALLLGNACAVFRRQSDLEAALEELESLLMQVDSEVDEDVMAIARKIKEQATQLLETHETFAKDFNRLAADRQVTQDTLVELASEYDTRRLAQRKRLLRTQDELHAAVPDDAWEEILAVLNKKGRAVVPPHAREA
jgi:phosphoglycerate-specific signal transduction histidine kinase